MTNRYGLPEAEVQRVRERDKRCVYCHKEMAKPGPEARRGDWATIEHLNHLPPWDNPETIAILFGSRAEGRARPDSDFDLLVVLDDEAPNSDADYDEVYAPLLDIDIGCDVIPCRCRCFARSSKIQRIPGRRLGHQRRESMDNQRALPEDHPWTEKIRSLNKHSPAAARYRYQTPEGLLLEPPGPRRLAQDVRGLTDLLEAARQFLK